MIVFIKDRKKRNSITKWVVKKEGEHGCKLEVILKVYFCCAVKKWLLHFTYPCFSLQSSNIFAWKEWAWTSKGNDCWIWELLYKFHSSYTGWSTFWLEPEHADRNANAHRHTVHTHFHAVNTAVVIWCGGFSSITSTVRNLSVYVSPSVRLVREDTFSAHGSWWTEKF